MFPQHVNRMVLDGEQSLSFSTPLWTSLISEIHLGVIDATVYYRDFLDHGRLSMADTNKVREA
jgi:hypothetical protein